MTVRVARVAKQIKDAGSVACSARERLRTPICAMPRASPGALPASRPEAQLANRGAKLGALLGQRIGDADRLAGLDISLDDALVLQLTKALREEAIGKARHGLREFPKAHRLLCQRADDRPGPPFADQLDSGVKMRADTRRGLLLGGGYCLHVDRAY